MTVAAIIIRGFIFVRSGRRATKAAASRRMLTVESNAKGVPSRIKTLARKLRITQLIHRATPRRRLALRELVRGQSSRRACRGWDLLQTNAVLITGWANARPARSSRMEARELAAKFAARVAAAHGPN